LRLLGETLLMAYAGTVLGAAGAFVLCFLGAANVAPRRWLRIVVRRFCELCRTVPELVFALVFVIAFGLGPMAGVLAVAIHTVGALGKLFAEVVENIDMKPVEGITASGSSWPVAMRFGVLPQTTSNFVSYALLRFEVNVRSTAVMGFVGAGGIGQDLIEAIRKFYYSDVSAILVLIVITVSVIDTLTSQVRHRLIGLEERH
jgi:phosphonate transport system permease protein